MSIAGIIINFIRGFCMALADSVPGVSGGTIAFLLGFYDQFISALDDLFHGTKERRLCAIKFLIKLGFGWIVGMGLSVLVLTSFFDSHIYEVSSLFMGFIVFAIPLVVMEEKQALQAKPACALFTLIGLVVVVAISFFNPTAGTGFEVAVESLSLFTVVYVFVAAMIAISAMVLPGISGSTLLLIFGLYVPIMSALRALMGMDFSYLPIVLVFGAGIACGILIFVRLIRRCLENFRSQTMYAIVGMMIGSLYAITQGPLTLTVPEPAMNFGTFSFLFFVIGGVLVIGLQVLKKRLEAIDTTAANKTK